MWKIFSTQGQRLPRRYWQYSSTNATPGVFTWRESRSRAWWLPGDWELDGESCVCLYLHLIKGDGCTHGQRGQGCKRSKWSRNFTERREELFEENKVQKIRAEYNFRYIYHLYIKYITSWQGCCRRNDWQSNIDNIKILAGKFSCPLYSHSACIDVLGSEQHIHKEQPNCRCANS